MASVLDGTSTRNGLTLPIMKSICLLAQKGGTGKTTLCLHLGVLATELGRRSAILDIDPQGSATAWRRRRQSSEPQVTKKAAEDLEESSSELSALGTEVLLLDTAPHSSEDATLAADFADLVLIVSRPAILDLEAIGESVKIIKQLDRKAAVVLNACPPPHRGGETAIVREAREALSVYGLPVSPVAVSQRAAFSHALIDGRAVTEYEGQSKAANEIRALWDWIESQW